MFGRDSCDTLCFTNLGKLSMVMVVQFKAQPIFSIDPAALKNEAFFKSGQIGLKNNYLAT
jgi:hypothetical protein